MGDIHMDMVMVMDIMEREKLRLMLPQDILIMVTLLMVMVDTDIHMDMVMVMDIMARGRLMLDITAMVATDTVVIMVMVAMEAMEAMDIMVKQQLFICSTFFLILIGICRNLVSRNTHQNTKN